MQKKLIAVAVASALMAPAVMAEVTVSGQIAAELVSIEGKAASKNGLYVTDAWGNGTSNTGNAGTLAFTATEKFDNGLTAVGRYAFNIKSDGTNPAVRDAYVGLKADDFGTVMVGRMNHPYKTSTIGWDPLLSTFAQARFNGGMASAAGNAAANTLYGAEVDNAIAYVNSFNKVRVAVAMLVDEKPKVDSTTGQTTDDSTAGKNALALSVNAPVGPVELALAYADLGETTNCTTTAARTRLVAGPDTNADGALIVTTETLTPASTACTVNKDATATKVGAKLVSGDLTVAGQYEMLDKGLTTRRIGADESKAGTAMFLTGSYALGGGNTVSLSYGQNSKEVGGGNKAVKYTAVGVNHAFSKTIRGYVAYRTTTDLPVFTGTGTARTVSDHVAENAFGVGMRVGF